MGGETDGCGRAREDHQRDAVPADAAPDRTLVTSAIGFLQQSRRHDEGRTQEKEQPPSRRRTAAGEDVDARARASRQRRPATGRVQGKRHRDRETGDDDQQLHQVDPRGTQEPARGEIGQRHDGADGASREQGKSAGHVQHRRDPEQLRREDGERPKPDQRRDQSPHGAAVATLEKITDGEIAMCRRFAPYPWSDRKREHQRADPCRAVPPPRAQPFGVAERRRADSGARTDVGGEEGGKDQAGAEAPARHEEVGRPGSASNPEPDCDKQPGVGNEEEKGAGQLPTSGNGRPAA